MPKGFHDFAGAASECWRCKGKLIFDNDPQLSRQFWNILNKSRKGGHGEDPYSDGLTCIHEEGKAGIDDLSPDSVGDVDVLKRPERTSLDCVVKSSPLEVSDDGPDVGYHKAWMSLDAESERPRSTHGNVLVFIEQEADQDLESIRVMAYVSDDFVANGLGMALLEDLHQVHYQEFTLIKWL